MKKHWTNYLPEAGTIVKQGQSQMYLAERISELQKQLADARAEHEQNEVAICKTALKEWTWAEIDEAKAEAEITQRTAEEKSAMHPIFEQALKPFGIK